MCAHQKRPVTVNLKVMFFMCVLLAVLAATHHMMMSQLVDHQLQPDLGYENGAIYRSSACSHLPGKTFKAWTRGTVSSVMPALEANCSKLIAGDKFEIGKVNKSLSTWKSVLSDKDVLKMVQNCTWLGEYFSDNLYNSELERSFPLAFTLVVNNSPQQVLRLLRLLYKPQNTYCIHYDAKSKHREFFQSIAHCLVNVIVPSKLENVVWGHYSVLAAQMNCMNDLLHFRTRQDNKWEYLLNLCGKELPLATNREIVRHLMKLNGSSFIMADHSAAFKKRIKYKVSLTQQNRLYVDKKSPLGNPPFNISQYYKSQSYVALSYPFTCYLTTNSRAEKIHNFFKNCKSPEEHFYATVFMMPGVPGGFNKEFKDLYFTMENVLWMYGHNNIKCHGKLVHSICIVGVGDLPTVVHGRRFFHNKYFMEYDHVVMKCMEERIVEKNKLEYQLECV